MPDTPFPIARPVDALTRPFRRFLRLQVASGAVLVVCALVALAAANSPWSGAWLAAWETPIGLGIGDATLVHTAREWINEGLMTIFFFVVGLELKREIAEGELSDLRRAALPAAAAVGGAAVPALLYAVLPTGPEGTAGWASPMATDIAFAVAALALFGSRVPAGLKVLLLALAIVDDLIAVLVIALFYAEALRFDWLLVSAGGFVLVLVMQALGVRSVRGYVAVGVATWLAFLGSGVHPTVAGVVFGLVTPWRDFVPPKKLLSMLETGKDQVAEAVARGDDLGDYRPLLRAISFTAREAISPLERLEVRLAPWSSFLVMPLFALANAGVPLAGMGIEPITAAIAVALFLGKPLGILGASAALAGLGLARLPVGVSWGMLAGVACLGGIGFTMSLFIAGLTWEGAAFDAARAGVLLGSAASAVLGTLVLHFTLPHSARRNSST